MENEELVQQIQAGIKVNENMERLYLQNRSFIYQQAKKYAACADIEDLMQEAYFALDKAARNYQPDKEAKFLSYFGYWLQSVLGRYIENNGRTKRIPSHLLQRISKYQKYISDQKAKGVEPSDFAICRDLDISKQQLKELRKFIYETETISTSDLLPGYDSLTVGDSLSDPADMEETILDAVAKGQAEKLIWKIVDELKVQQAEIIIGHFKESATLKEIAERLNLSYPRVKQIERDALSILRSKQEITDIAEIYGYMNSYRNTGYTAFKYNGSSVENAALRHIEGEERIQALKKKIESRKDKIQNTLNIDELFSQVLNFATE